MAVSEWSRMIAVNRRLLVLFAGLFVMTAELEHSGLIDALLHWAATANLQSPAVLTVVTAVLSHVVSNVPAVHLDRRYRPRSGRAFQK